MSWFNFGGKKPPAKPAGKPAARPVAKRATPSGGHRPASPFHAVEVKHGPDCCHAAQAVQGKRFLSRDNPPPPGLPLTDCDKPAHCQCRYIHYDDRRTEDRRSTWGGIFTTWDTNGQFEGRGPGKARRSRGRRKDD